MASEEERMMHDGTSVDEDISEPVQPQDDVAVEMDNADNVVDEPMTDGYDNDVRDDAQPDQPDIVEQYADGVDEEIAAAGGCEWGRSGRWGWDSDDGSGHG
nr:hypothetical protein BaRGS_016733 [Batillaria attramentaria]